MPDLRAAILAAAQAASDMHTRYGTKIRAADGEGRIDVFGMLDEQGIPMMFQRLDKLLGAFLDEDGSKGVIVTTQRQLPVQRFTAAGKNTCWSATAGEAGGGWWDMPGWRRRT